MNQTPIHPRSSYPAYSQTPSDEYHSPGVYVRNRHQGHHAPSGAPDLDMLWAGNKGLGRDERSSLLVFLGGCLVGGFITAAGFMLFINKPQMSPEEAAALSPIPAAIESVQSATQAVTASASPNLPLTSSSSGVRASGMTTSTPVPKTVGGQTYVIQSGDTLQTIAQKFYGSADDVYVLKIQNANHLESPHMIMIDQALVIPPA